jgi:D-alanyl-D-alanine carboxypeptidase/D-alanyl-D-alanine-endopeptidase (penicillin-binding protein 4)
MKRSLILTLFSLTTLCSVNPLLAQELSLPLDNNVYQESQPINNDSYQELEPVEIFVPPPENNQPKICSTELEQSIGEVINRYKGKWGVLVQRLEDGETVYQYNADLGLIPASNMKILTTAAALQILDPQTTISANKSLREWVNVTNLRSDNFYADTLLKRIGGGSVAKQTLTQLGVNPNAFHFADGSGLSRNNTATPRALVDTLRAMYYTPSRDVFMASLPTAGVSGTLRNRFKQTPAQGFVHAKTGTLRGVRALSGYIEHPQQGILIFSILANQPGQTGDSLVRAIDEIVLKLNMTSSCN